MGKVRWDHHLCGRLHHRAPRRPWRLFDGFGQSVELEHLAVRQSPFAAFIDYRVKK